MLRREMPANSNWMAPAEIVRNRCVNRLAL
jgi:hypothetical protein